MARVTGKEIDMTYALFVIVILVFLAYHTGYVAGAFKITYKKEIDKLTIRERILLAALITIAPISLPMGWLKLYAEENLKSKETTNADHRN